MASQPHSIKPLSPESQAQIRSSVNITSLNDVVVGLLENVLDAGATSAEIRLDYVKGFCSVTDNGPGIPAVEFEVGGHLGSLHCTSKLDASCPMYGRHGRFLYHLSALSFLNITSRCGFDASAITFHRAKAIARSNGDGHCPDLLYGNHGTHVAVANLFGDIPVRYQHIAAQLGAVALADAEFTLLQKRVVALLLACGRPIDVRLTDLKTRRTFRNINDTLGQEMGFDLDAIGSILLHAAYIEPSQTRSFQGISVQTSSILIRAAVSLHPTPSKDVQFISIGIRPLHASTSSFVFQDEINRMFEQSSFGALEAEFDGSEDERYRPHRDRRFAADRHTKRQLNGQKKGIDKWPMFYVRIDLRDTRASTALDEEGRGNRITENWTEKVLDLLKSMFHEFLSVHHLRPRSERRRFDTVRVDSDREGTGNILSVNDAGHDLQGLPLRTGSNPWPVPAPKHFNGWSRAKAGTGVAKSAHTSHTLKEGDSRNVKNQAPTRPQTPSERIQLGQIALGEEELRQLDDGAFAQLVQNYEDEANFQNAMHEPDDKPELDSQSSAIAQEAAMLWTDPATGIEHMINARNGCIIRRDDTSNEKEGTASKLYASEKRISVITKLGNASGIRLKSLRKKPEDLAVSLQQSNLLRSFRPLEEPILSITTEEAEIATPTWDKHDCEHVPRKISEHFSAPTTKQALNLRKADLESAEVLAQVDQKFILIQTRPPRESSPVLVLLDQHAADERVKVEQLYMQLCSNETTTLIKPIIFEVPTREIELFSKQQKYFAEWHIIYSVNHKTFHQNPMNQITVTGLPSLISERCRLDPKLLIDLLRREIYNKTSALPAPTSSNWIHRIPHCPTALVEMIMSRACRSAIMFNDVLERAQCQELVRKLAGCTLPFQCAHGRPSCVILPGWEGWTEVNEELGFVERFKAWTDVDAQ